MPIIRREFKNVEYMADALERYPQRKTRENFLKTLTEYELVRLLNLYSKNHTLWPASISFGNEVDNEIRRRRGEPPRSAEEYFPREVRDFLSLEKTYKMFKYKSGSTSFPTYVKRRKNR